jgi:hypothetical protein
MTLSPPHEQLHIGLACRMREDITEVAKLDTRPDPAANNPADRLDGFRALSGCDPFDGCKVNVR